MRRIPVAGRCALASITARIRIKRTGKHGEYDMNKLILCSVAALALSMGSATAKTKTAVITLDGFCDTFTITSDGGNVGLSSTNESCDPGIGSGYIGKIKKHGGMAAIGAILNGDPNTHWAIGVQYPLVTGGAFHFGFTTDGINIGNDILNGTYTVAGTATKGPRGSKSITSLIHK